MVCIADHTASAKRRQAEKQETTTGRESAGVTRTYLLGGPLHELLDEHGGRSSIHGAARRGGGPSERQAPPTGSTRAEIGYPFPSREEEEAGSAAPSKLLTSCSGAGSKRNRPRQRKAGQGERWRGVEDGRGGWGRGGVGVRRAVKDQVLVASWPFSALRCVVFTGLATALAWQVWSLENERKGRRAGDRRGLKGRSLGQAD